MVSAADPLLPQSRFSRPDFTRTLAQSTSLEHSTPWPVFASELYRPRDRRLSGKSVSTFADRVCYVVSVTDP
jgi:hypothetical protein